MLNKKARRKQKQAMELKRDAENEIVREQTNLLRQDLIVALERACEGAPDWALISDLDRKIALSEQKPAPRAVSSLDEFQRVLSDEGV